MPAHNHSSTASTTNIYGYFPADTRDYHRTVYGGVFSQTYLGKQANGSDGNSFTYRYNLNANVLPSLTVSNKGGGVAHNIIQPYISVYIWKRIS